MHIPSLQHNILLTLILMMLWPVMGAAQDPGPWLWRGELLSDQRLLLQDRHQSLWAWNEHRLDLQLGRRSDRMRVEVSTWLSHIGPSAAASSSQLASKHHTDPWQFDLREAYVEVYEFLSEKADLKVGKQFIHWGTADRFNPSSTFNPHDLQDLLAFGRRRGVEALSYQWHFSHDFSLEAVLVPLFRPSNTPTGIFSDIFMAGSEWPVDIEINQYTDHLLLPDNSLKEASSAGIRLRGFLLNTDFSLSYTYGRISLPLPSQVSLSLDPGGEGMDVVASLLYPRQHVIGADLAGHIGPIGIWGELAVHLPTKAITAQVEVTWLAPPFNQTSQVALKKEAYARFVIGGDYSFRGGTYLNVQYLHGFLHEHGRDERNDYLLLTLEKPLLNHRLMIRPLNGGLSITDRRQPAENYAVFYMPEITYQGIDNLEIILGASLFHGQGGGLFATLKEYDMLRLSARVSF